MTLDRQLVEFHINTGADVTVITKKLYKQLRSPQLQKCSKSLNGPSKEALHVQGQFNGAFRHGNNSTNQEIFVIKGLASL